MKRISFNELPQDYFAGMTKMGEILKKSSLDRRLLELVEFRASQINNCAYCLDMHYKEAVYHGETELRLISVSAWREAPYYTDREKAALQYTEELTNVSAHGYNPKLTQTLSHHFSKEEIQDLTMAIVVINAWNRFTVGFEIEPGRYEVGT